jgi:hypothetical protein
VSLAEPGEVPEHALREVGLCLGLGLDVDQEKCRLSLQARLNEQIDLMAIARRHVREDFFVQRHQRGVFELVGEFGHEQAQEVEEERAQEFFEEAIVIHPMEHNTK